MKFFLTLFVFLNLSCLPARAEALKVGPVYADRPGEISALVEAPELNTRRAAEFRLLLDNRPVVAAINIDTFENSGKEMALVVCVDVGSSAGKIAVNEIKAALLFLIGMAAERPNDKIALITYADDIRIDTAFDKPRDQFVDAVLQLSARGSHSRLYDALNRSLDLIDRQDLPKRRRIIVLSSGRDDGSINTLEKTALKAKSSGVPIDITGFGKTDRTCWQTMGKISDSAGGQFTEAGVESNRLRNGVAGLYRDLLGGRSMMVHFSYEVENSAGKVTTASIEVTQSGKKTLVAGLPGTYAPPKQPALTTPENQPGLASGLKSKTSPSPSSRYPSWLTQNWRLLLLVLIALLLLPATLFFILRRPKAARVSENFENQAVATGESARDTVITPQPKRVTLVGGYFFPAPEPGKPSAQLAGIEGSAQETRHEIDKELFYIGRDEGNDLCLPDDNRVSRQHAYLRYERGSLFIFDAGSNSGTYVNQKQIAETGEVLEPGDQIKIGLSVFEVQKHHGNAI